VFNLSWQFYGQAPAGAAVVPFGLAPAAAAAANAQPATFGAYWLDGGRVVGVFVESGSADENAAAKAVAAARPAAAEEELRTGGAGFLLAAAARL
jgi:monodehydroascorbate reductase (NADH)